MLDGEVKAAMIRLWAELRVELTGEQVIMIRNAELSSW